MAKQLILCADDFGCAESVNAAVITLAKQQRVNATSCMTNYPHWASGAAQLRRLNNISCGLHFNLPLAQPWALIKSYLRLFNQKRVADALRTQIHLFREHMQRDPDFIDGHTHIHTHPQIRDAFVSVYLDEFPEKKPWVRNCNPTDKHLKSRILRHTNQPLLQLLKENNIPHNTSFTGVYSFDGDYRQQFVQFLQQTTHPAVMMCHPALPDATLENNRARYNEFLYFSSEQFIVDLNHHMVHLQPCNLINTQNH